MLYLLSIMFVKLSLLAFYHRLFAEASRSTEHLVAGASALVALFYPIMAIRALAVCLPRRGESRLDAWYSRRCTGKGGCFLAVAVFNIVSNLGLFALPVRVVWRLQMSRRRKVAICALFFVDLL
jgi:hypothetical protein